MADSPTKNLTRLLLDWKAGNKAALDELNAAYQAAGASLYASSGAAQGAPEGDGQPQPAEEAPKEDVVEADYEIVDESKKQ